MKYKNRKKNKKSYFVYTSLIIHLYFLTFVEITYTSIIHLSVNRNKEIYLSILLSFKINTSILKAYFKYTPKFEKKYINLENLLQVYSAVSRAISKIVYWLGIPNSDLQTLNKPHFAYISLDFWCKFSPPFAVAEP